MKITHEKPSQRFHARVTAPLYATLDGETYRAEDWSLGGLRIAGLTAALRPGDRRQAGIRIPFQGYSIEFTETVELVRLNGDEGGFRFVALSARSEELLSHFLDGILRGRVVAAGETLQHLDAPTSAEDGANKGKSEDPREQLRRRWRSRAVLTLYMTLAIAILGYLGLAIYNNLLRIEVDTAYVRAPLQTLTAPQDGTVADILVEDGAALAAGDPAIALDQPDLELEIDEAEAALAQAEKAVDARRAALDRAKTTAQDYDALAATNERAARATITAVRTQLASARDRAERLGKLAQQGHATQTRLDAVREAVAALEERLAGARKRLEHAQRTARLADGGRFFNDDRIVDEIAEPRLALATAQARAVEARARVAALKRHRETMIVRAPASGRVLELTRQIGESVSRGEPIAIFERTREPREVVVYMAQSDIGHISQGDAARILFAGAQSWIKGTVTRVARSPLTGRDPARPGTWRGPAERTAVAVIAFDTLSPAEIRAHTSPGLPATVMLKRYVNLPGLREVSRALPWPDGR